MLEQCRLLYQGTERGFGLARPRWHLKAACMLVRRSGCFCKLGVLYLGVLITRALLFEAVVGPVIFGNSHLLPVALRTLQGPNGNEHSGFL